MISPVHFENKTTPSGYHIAKGYVQFDFYANFDIAISIYSEEDGYPELYSIPTVVLDDYFIFTSRGCVMIKDYSENVGMVGFLQDLGIIGEPFQEHTFGQFGTTALECALLVDGVAETYQELMAEAE